MNVLENIQVGDWVCCDNAQPDLRCRQVVKRTLKKIWTNLKDQPFRLDGKRDRRDMYHVRPATPADMAAWEAAKQAAIDRREKAETDKKKQIRQEQIRDAADDLLAACKQVLLNIGEPQRFSCLTRNQLQFFAEVAASILTQVIDKAEHKPQQEQEPIP